MGLSKDSKISLTDTLFQSTLNPAPSGSGGQKPRHRKVGGSLGKTKCCDDDCQRVCSFVKSEQNVWLIQCDAQ